MRTLSKGKRDIRAINNLSCTVHTYLEEIESRGSTDGLDDYEMKMVDCVMAYFLGRKRWNKFYNKSVK